MKHEGGRAGLRMRRDAMEQRRVRRLWVWLWAVVALAAVAVALDLPAAPNPMAAGGRGDPSVGDRPIAGGGRPPRDPVEPGIPHAGTGRAYSRIPVPSPGDDTPGLPSRPLSHRRTPASLPGSTHGNGPPFRGVPSARRGNQKIPAPQGVGHYYQEGAYRLVALDRPLCAGETCKAQIRYHIWFPVGPMQSAAPELNRASGRP